MSQCIYINMDIQVLVGAEETELHVGRIWLDVDLTDTILVTVYSIILQF